MAAQVHYHPGVGQNFESSRDSPVPKLAENRDLQQESRNHVRKKVSRKKINIVNNISLIILTFPRSRKFLNPPNLEFNFLIAVFEQNFFTLTQIFSKSSPVAGPRRTTMHELKQKVTSEEQK